MNIYVEDIERKITSKTKAVIVVHLAGHPCDMDAIHELAKAKGIKVWRMQRMLVEPNIKATDRIDQRFDLLQLPCS